MSETLVTTILPHDLSKHTNPHHLKAWLKLHFGKGGFHVRGHFEEETRNTRMVAKMYKIWAPRKIFEVSEVPEVWREAPFHVGKAAKTYAGRTEIIVGI